MPVSLFVRSYVSPAEQMDQLIILNIFCLDFHKYQQQRNNILRRQYIPEAHVPTFLCRYSAASVLHFLFKMLKGKSG
jgi:hypothetical protein